MGSACICPFFILSNPFLNGFTPYSLDSTCCDDCGCLAFAFEFVPGAAADANSFAEVSDCHHVHYVHILCLSSPWCWLSYKIVCSTEPLREKGMFYQCSVCIFVVRIQCADALENFVLAPPFFSSFLFFLFSRPIILFLSVTYLPKCEQSRV